MISNHFKQRYLFPTNTSSRNTTQLLKMVSSYLHITLSRVDYHVILVKKLMKILANPVNKLTNNHHQCCFVENIFTRYGRFQNVSLPLTHLTNILKSCQSNWRLSDTMMHGTHQQKLKTTLLLLQMKTKQLTDY